MLLDLRLMRGILYVLELNLVNGLTESSYLIDLTEGYEGLVGED